ncbi:MAG TPA: helix-turn-helix domain-containing protein [Pseudoxanthomonas sp.]
MNTLADRIRLARTQAKMSQQVLADVVGVHRAAVAQWEKNHGHMPTMSHLINIAIATGVMLEWLGTGRGPVKLDMETWIPALRPDEYAQDDRELECLAALRQMPVRVRSHVVGLAKMMAEPYKGRTLLDKARSDNRNSIDAVMPYP